MKNKLEVGASDVVMISTLGRRFSLSIASEQSKDTNALLLPSVRRLPIDGVYLADARYASKTMDIKY